MQRGGAQWRELEREEKIRLRILGEKKKLSYVQRMLNRGKAPKA